MSTFDRYILRRFLHVYFISFVAMVGLYVIIDAFNHADEFFSQPEAGLMSAMWGMGRYYGYRTCLFFDTIGDVILLTAVSVVLTLVLRSGELNPILAAGIPSHRLLLPLVWAAILVSALIAINQELVIPSIASELRLRPGRTGSEEVLVESVRDYKTMVEISADKLVLEEKKLLQPTFIIPAPQLADEVSGISGKEAIFQPAGGERQRSGWLVKGSGRRFDELLLTPAGRQVVHRGENPDEIFVTSEIGVEFFYMSTKSSDFLSIPQLVARIKSPSIDPLSVRDLTMNFHKRFTRPLLNVIQLFLILPALIRREARGLVVGMILSGLMQGAVFGSSQLFFWLANIDRIGPDLAAWGPVFVAGGLATWFWPMLRT